MIAWLKREWCVVFGHRRGKRVTDVIGIAQSCAIGQIVYRCPRCHATWTRKVRPPKAKERPDNPNATRYEGQQ